MMLNLYVHASILKWEDRQQSSQTMLQTREQRRQKQVERRVKEQLKRASGRKPLLHVHLLLLLSLFVSFHRSTRIFHIFREKSTKI